MRLLLLPLQAQKCSITCPLSPTHNVTFAGIRMLKALIPKPTFPPTFGSSSGVCSSSAAESGAPTAGRPLLCSRLCPASARPAAQSTPGGAQTLPWTVRAGVQLLSFWEPNACGPDVELRRHPARLQGQVSPTGRPHGDLNGQRPAGSAGQNPARPRRAPGSCATLPLLSQCGNIRNKAHSKCNTLQPS